jgi:hypothetical protein
MRYKITSKSKENSKKEKIINLLYCIRVDLAMLSKEKATVSIYNALGEKLLEKDLSKETRKENFDLSAFSKGIYLLNVITGNVTVTKRVIVK